jgi:hypothetical protein
LLPGYSCSVTLTHVGAFVLHDDGDRYIYNDDYIEGTFTAKLRQESADCAGEGNCSPYKDITVSNGKFRINKSGAYTPAPVVSTGNGILGKLLKDQLAGDYVLKCSASPGQPVKAYPFHIDQDGSSSLDGAPLVDATHAGAIVVEGFASSANGITVKFAPQAANSDYVVLGFTGDGSFKPNSIYSSGSVFTCYTNTGHSAPAAATQTISQIPGVAGALARSETLNCSKAGTTSAQAFTINSDGSAQIGGESYAASKLFKLSDNILFGTNKAATVEYSDVQIVNGQANVRTLSISLDQDRRTTGVVYAVGQGPNDVSICSPQS